MPLLDNYREQRDKLFCIERPYNEMRLTTDGNESQSWLIVSIPTTVISKASWNTSFTMSITYEKGKSMHFKTIDAISIFVGSLNEKQKKWCEAKCQNDFF